MNWIHTEERSLSKWQAAPGFSTSENTSLDMSPPMRIPDYTLNDHTEETQPYHDFNFYNGFESSPVEAGPKRSLEDGDEYHRQALPSIFDVYKRRYQKMNEVRSEYQSQMTDAQYQSTNVQDSLQHLRDSFEQAMGGIKISRPGRVPGKQALHSKKRQLRLQANTDMDMLHQRVQDLTTLINDLRSSVARLENAEKAFDNASRAIFTVMGANSVVNDDGGWTEVSLKPSSIYRSTDSTSSAPPVLPQLARYYEAVGDLKIMRERLQDLRIERQEQWERHTLLVDQEGFSGPSDEDFTNEWRQNFEIAEEDLRFANNAVADTRQSCLDAQISIPTWAAISLSSYASDEEPRVPHHVEPLGSLNGSLTRNAPSRSLIDGVKVVPVISGQPVHYNSSPLLTPPIEQSNTHEKVNNWLESVRHEVMTTATSEQGDHKKIDAQNSFEHVVTDAHNTNCISSPASLM